MSNMTKRITIGVAVVLGVFFIGTYFIDRYMLGETYARYTPEGLSPLLTEEDVAADYPSEEVSFEMDGKTLRGRVYSASGAGDSGGASGLIIFRHGIFSHHEDYLALITALVDKGWKVFAYDAIGCGDSDGDSVKGFAQSPLDVRAAVQFALDTNMAEGMPIVLLGHSWGGYGVAGALDFEDVRDNVSACVALSGFDEPNGIISESANRAMGPVAVLGAPMINAIGFLDFGPDANRSAARAIGNCNVPTLVIHGTNDEVISIDGASIMAKRDSISNPNVEYIVKDEAGRNGHNSYFYSPESQAYFNECKVEADRLTEQYGNDIPADVAESYMASIDKRRANTADPVLVDEIDSFFCKNI